MWNLKDNPKVGGSFFMLLESPPENKIIFEVQDYDCPLFEVSGDPGSRPALLSVDWNVTIS